MLIGGGGEGGGVPSDDVFVAIGTEVEGEHLAVEVFADEYFIVFFGVGDSEAVGYFNLFCVFEMGGIMDENVKRDGRNTNDFRLDGPRDD